MVIYIDILLITNFIITYFLLISSAILTGYTYSRKRILISSLCGAMFCLYIFCAGYMLVIDITVKILSLFVCVITAFGISDKRKIIVQTICFVFLNMLLVGAISATADRSARIYSNNMFFYININPVNLVAATLVIYGFITVFSLLKEKVSPQILYVADVYIEGQCMRNISLFYDSGFRVRDIISNKNIIMLSFEKNKQFLTETHKTNISCFLSGDYDKVTCRYFPVFFNTVQGNGMIPAIKAEYIIINDKRIENILVAFVDDSFSENVDGIFGNDIKKLL